MQYNGFPGSYQNSGHFFLNMNLKNIEYKDHVTFIEFQTFFLIPELETDTYMYCQDISPSIRQQLAHSYVNSVQKAPKNIILCAIGTLN